MKRVAIYGIENRRILIKIAQYLSKEYRIVAYLDESDNKEDRYFSCKPLYSIKYVFDMGYIEKFEYVIVAYSDNSQNRIKEMVDRGMNEKKVLDWSIAQNFMWENPIETFKLKDFFYDGLIFGMSHSYWGLLTSELSKPFFKFSMPALDLFYINKQCQEILNENYLGKPDNNGKDYRSKCKYILLEMPYYFFNYDMSMNIRHMSNQAILGDYFDDYHNFLSRDESRLVLRQYDLWKDMIFEGIRYNISYNYCDHINREMGITNEMIEESKESISHVWEKTHEDTKAENIKLLYKIIKSIHNFDQKIHIVFLVMPQSKYYYLYHEDVIDQRKKEFKNIVNEVCDMCKANYQIMDYYDIFFSHDYLFYDLIHLNSSGAKVFTENLDQIFRKKLYIGEIEET